MNSIFYPPPYLFESVISDNDDPEVVCEKAGNLIGKVVDSINTLVKRLVKSFDDLMRKNKTEKTIKELEKLPKNMRLEADIDLKDAADTYSDLLEGYQDAVRNPDKASRLDDKVKKAKEKRKKLVKKVAIGTTVGAVIAYLSLLVRKNNQKEYMLTSNRYDAANKIHPFSKKMRLGEDDRKEMDQIYKNYSTAREAIQESEYFRLKLYSSITKTIKGIGRNIKGTFKYGLKDVGEQMTGTGRYSKIPLSARQDDLEYLDNMDNR